MALVGFESGTQGRVRYLVEGVVVWREDSYVGLEGEVGIDVAIGSQQSGELAEILV